MPLTKSNQLTAKVVTKGNVRGRDPKELAQTSVLSDALGFQLKPWTAKVVMFFRLYHFFHFDLYIPFHF
ncbi:hypothetical protein CDO51_12570 [Natranaerobius trueperi]|uniref:Uncharacterized protein n=1 Tax=Natranaerobius trueperi TaxID=759412 RepID=A0A226BWZ5_9FIRM|nr:hypothetical protein CDO51_12570 [Natranaerobius trueperi]